MRENILIYGMGISGISSAKTLSKMNFNVYTYDYKKTNIDQLEGYEYSPIYKSEDIFKIDYKYVLKSPGIKPSDELYKKLKEKYNVINDIELSYVLFPQKKTISITGTNGKTTTTSMINFILNNSNIKSISVGNIGEGILYQMYKNDCVFVEELSSFQLHEIDTYRSKISIILNITQDHLDWHKDYGDYINSKLNIIKNQREDDYFIKNHDDPLLKNVESKGINLEISTKEKVANGMYYKDGSIYLVEDGKKSHYIDTDKLQIVGVHNFENTMASILSLRAFGLSDKSIKENIVKFKAISHRLQFVKEIEGVKFYNDSKATNVDSTVKALSGFKENVILIAGGYDKKVDYMPMIKAYKGKDKFMVVIGETKDQIKSLCDKENIICYKANTLKEAMDIIKGKMEKGDIVLLSPASASWGMYRGFEERGNEFIDLVNLMEEK